MDKNGYTADPTVSRLAGAAILALPITFAFLFILA